MKGQGSSNNRLSHRSSVANRCPKPVVWVKPLLLAQCSCTLRSPSRIMHGDVPRARTQQSMPPPGLHMEKFSGAACAPLNSPEFTECSRAHLEETPGTLRREGVTGMWRTPSLPGYGCRRVENPPNFFFFTCRFWKEQNSGLSPNLQKKTQFVQQMRGGGRDIQVAHVCGWRNGWCGSGHKVVFHHDVKAEVDKFGVHFDYVFML